MYIFYVKNLVKKQGQRAYLLMELFNGALLFRYHLFHCMLSITVYFMLMLLTE